MECQLVYKQKLTGSKPEIKANLTNLQCPRKLRLRLDLD